MHEVSYIRAWVNLGLCFSEKLKGAVALQTYRIKGGEENKRTAVKHLENALSFWDVVIEITRPIYNDMPLVHYCEEDDNRRFHWAILRTEVAEDIETARNAEVIQSK